MLAPLTGISLYLWVSAGIVLACATALSLLRTTESVHYPNKLDPMCFDCARMRVVFKGILWGMLIAAVPTSICIHAIGHLQPSTSVLFGFLLGPVIFNGWLMRTYQSIENGASCEHVRKGIASLYHAAIVLGALVMVVVLNLVAT